MPGTGSGTRNGTIPAYRTGHSILSHESRPLFRPMLTLIVPGLVWPRQALADLVGDLPLPALAALLRAGRLARRPPADGAAALAAQAGLDGALPVAALRRHASHDDAGEADWLCLDPVRLDFAERHVVVADPARLGLTEADAQALAASLAPTFGELGRLDVLAPGHWALRLAAPAPAFPPLPEAVGRAATALPPGVPFAPWRRALNEAQMILHGHPVNAVREAAGRPPVNSLWPWGGGRLPAARPTSWHEFLGDDPALRGLARRLGIEGGTLPARLQPSPHATLAVVDALEAPARSGDALPWRDALAHLDADWLAPALAALRRGRLDSLVLVAPGDPGSVELTVRRNDLWRFWHRPVTPAAAFGLEAPT